MAYYANQDWRLFEVWSIEKYWMDVEGWEPAVCSRDVVTLIHGRVLAERPVRRLTADKQIMSGDRPTNVTLRR